MRAPIPRITDIGNYYAMNHEAGTTTQPESTQTDCGAGLHTKEVATLRSLNEVTAYRHETQERLDDEYARQKKIADKEYAAAEAKLTETFKQQYASTEKEYKQKLDQIASQFTSDHTATKQEFEQTLAKIKESFEEAKEELEEEYEQNTWEAKSIYEAAVNGAAEERKDAKRTRELGSKTRKELLEQSQDFLTKCGIYAKCAPLLTIEDLPRDDEDPLAAFEACIAESKQHFENIKNVKELKLIKPGLVFVIGFAIFIVAGGALFFVHPAAGVFGGLLLGVVGATVVRMQMVNKARKQIMQDFQPMHQKLADSLKLRDSSKTASERKYKEALEDAKVKRDQEKENLANELRRKIADLKKKRDYEINEANQEFPRRLAEIEQTNADEREKTKQVYPARLAKLKEDLEANKKAIRDEHEQRLSGTGSAYQKGWAELTERWNNTMEESRSNIKEINERSGALFPPWDSDVWNEDWQAPRLTPRTVPIGTIDVDVNAMPGGIPDDERLPLLIDPRFDLPALTPFPGKASIMIKASGEAKEKAEQTLQALMFRYLSAVPPAKLRFTILDPVGLGQSFSAFMHLKDYQEQLVTNRIWTEGGHIDQQLKDLTGHMENVIQAYLRNQYETIEEYNEQAGDIAEPFRVLVVANFPVNFSEAAARRLVSIASSGPRCGVHVLITVDQDQPLPHGFNLDDLVQHCSNLQITGNAPKWDDEELGKYPLTVQSAPPSDFATRMMHVIGKKALEAGEVQVPFEFIAPSEEEWWTSGSNRGVKVALGQAGATKRQFLELGKGTSQHVLTAGKTGSGKSTLLHVLITNLALTYSPNEMELYLLDFKKGVEFKTYASQQLPHARVIAIESEREFGLSVMQRLDAELKRRGDMFREAGAQDIASFREARPDAVMPRILFIVDEFQELFTEDDKIAQDCSLLLDRLVRQGRAFGVHVFLGSQTLGGAYSLARTTIDQMGVRIALQCSEADAHLILSEDNSAARLLNRPGEAIYNDANGLVEGNNPFQIVWIDDGKREEYLKQLRVKLDEQGITVPGQIVFEGNIPAEVTRNNLLMNQLDAPTHPEKSPRAAKIWMGDAVAIKDPTSCGFAAESGNNMIMIGHEEEGTLAVMATAMISLATQLPVAMGDQPGTRFYVLDGTRAEDPYAGLLEKVAGALPHYVKMVGRRELDPVMKQLTAELQRRQDDPDATHAPIFIFIHNLSRYRDLRKEEDDFGFGKSDAPASASKMFGELVREGAAFGMHLVIWCDNLNNVNRVFDRALLREFEYRVLFQMSANDSSALIDTPAASRLGVNRALFHSEEAGTSEKFRPYRVPDEKWLERVKSTLGGKTPDVAFDDLPLPSAPEPASKKDDFDDDFGKSSGGGFSKFDWDNKDEDSDED